MLTKGGPCRASSAPALRRLEPENCKHFCGSLESVYTYLLQGLVRSERSPIRRAAALRLGPEAAATGGAGPGRVPAAASHPLDACLPLRRRKTR